mmetsp:Transcript_10962/g.26957  ORF Transcript_10962/g.26957 Transcript_10962/m.26957 type:complete len:289 (-) Transcript_10962:445-1311(-)
MARSHEMRRLRCASSLMFTRSSVSSMYSPRVLSRLYTLSMCMKYASSNISTSAISSFMMDECEEVALVPDRQLVMERRDRRDSGVHSLLAGPGGLPPIMAPGSRLRAGLMACSREGGSSPWSITSSSCTASSAMDRSPSSAACAASSAAARAASFALRFISHMSLSSSSRASSTSLNVSATLSSADRRVLMRRTRSSSEGCTLSAMASTVGYAMSSSCVARSSTSHVSSSRQISSTLSSNDSSPSGSAVGGAPPASRPADLDAARGACSRCLSSFRKAMDAGSSGDTM